MKKKKKKALVGMIPEAFPHNPCMQREAIIIVLVQQGILFFKGSWEKEKKTINVPNSFCL